MSFSKQTTTRFPTEGVHRIQESTDTAKISDENEILQAMLRGELFGMVECDIRVPDQWPSHFNHSSMTPYQYFEEMCPLFCTTNVSFDVIGEHMQQHARRFDLSEKPRRLLIGDMKARQILLTTPLLKWYVEHGMEVTKIYQVIEFTPHRCFREFVKEVSDNRRLGDTHPDKSIFSDTSKLHGNSAYGVPSWIRRSSNPKRTYKTWDRSWWRSTNRNLGNWLLC